MKRRIAITMRVVESNHGELRDAIAQDWAIFLNAVLPDALYIPIPNIEKKSIAMVQELGVNALILTGGENWGLFPKRDTTEEGLFHWAKEQAFPILGVCRGMQLMLQFSGKSLIPVQGHIATKHLIQFTSDKLINSGQIISSGQAISSGKKVMVNSFHSYGISDSNYASNVNANDCTNGTNDINDCTNTLQTLAVCEDGTIEAIHHTSLPILGVLWHPEREKVPTEHDKLLIQELFKI